MLKSSNVDTGPREGAFAPQPSISKVGSTVRRLIAWQDARGFDTTKVWNPECGTGRLGAGLALSSGLSVVATDSNARNISGAEFVVDSYRRATPTAQLDIRYQCTHPANSGLPDSSVDFVIAQQVHTIDLPAFFSEVRRVARPGALIALTAYEKMSINPDADTCVNSFYEDVLSGYRTPTEKLLDDGLRSAPFPFTPIKINPDPPRFLQASWSLPRLVEHISALPVVQRMVDDGHWLPTAPLNVQLKKIWGRIEKCRVITWPLALRVGIVE